LRGLWVLRNSLPCCHQGSLRQSLAHNSHVGWTRS
jgi:hypothetical protein